MKETNYKLGEQLFLCVSPFHGEHIILHAQNICFFAKG